MTSARKVAVVTGGNRGIGREIVRSLSLKFDGDIILTARTEGQGRAAVKCLEKESEVRLLFHPLDVTDEASVRALRDFLITSYGGLDVLVNNAGIMFQMGSREALGVEVRETMGVNFWGCLRCCKLLFPLLRPGARVVNVSSMYCRSTLRDCSPSLRTKLTSQHITMAQLEALMTDFEKSADSGKCALQGWPTFAYGVSKIGVTVMTQIQQREIDRDRGNSDILINACCPGWCSTEMGGSAAPKTPAQGADTPVYLSLLQPGCQSPRGALCSNRTVQQWG